jgi:peptide/nickel transport system permease protein
MGTDAIGRDVLVRLLWGGRASLGVGFASMALVTLLGIALGGLAGYFRGWIDSGVSACIELLQSFPSFLLVLAAIGIGLDGELGRRVSPLVWVVAVIGLVGWTGVARLVRAESLRVRTLDYVTAARALGFSPPRVLLRHVLPNCLAPAIVAAAFALAYAILTESAVSFFGLGVRAPTPSWGSIMQSERAVSHAWTFVFPGLAIAASCASCAWIGDALRDALDPREGS